MSYTWLDSLSSTCQGFHSDRILVSPARAVPLCSNDLLMLGKPLHNGKSSVFVGLSVALPGILSLPAQRLA
eukprot:765419-Hanusia_phi.AAC.2